MVAASSSVVALVGTTTKPVPVGKGAAVVVSTKATEAEDEIGIVGIDIAVVSEDVAWFADAVEFQTVLHDSSGFSISPGTSGQSRRYLCQH